MARKLGTGKIADESSARKWAGGVKSQIASATHHKSLNARYVPLGQINLDPKNPRQLAVNLSQVTSISKRFPLKPEWLKADAEANKLEWWDEFAAEIATALQDKALQDYLDLALLALSIKNHERLINPVTVYASDSGSDLHLIAGERRYLAHVILGEEFIAARILPHRPDGLEKDILQWEENNQRMELTLDEQLMNLQRLLTGWEKQRGGQLSVSQLVALAGIPRVTAHRYLTVIRYPNGQLMEAIKAGKVTSLRKAADLAALSPKELDAALNPPKAMAKSQPVFRIKRSKDYTPIKTILRAAAEQLGGKAYLKILDSQELDSAESIAEAFDELVNHVAGKANEE